MAHGERGRGREGAKKDHPHQRGIWFAHDNVNGIDFWNNEAGYKEPPKRGKMVLEEGRRRSRAARTRGPSAATFDWTDRQGNVLLTEDSGHDLLCRQGRCRTIDFDITLTSVAEGGVGRQQGWRVRHPACGPSSMSRAAPGKIMNADGLAGEKQLWGKPSNWCDYSGTIGDEKVGVAILDHPENPRHPVRWHARGYGLFAANPFGVAAFTNDKSQNGPRPWSRANRCTFDIG